jgi:hypothetical protein
MRFDVESAARAGRNRAPKARKIIAQRFSAGWVKRKK